MATLRLSDLDPVARARLYRDNLLAPGGARRMAAGGRARGGKLAGRAGKAFEELILLSTICPGSEEVLERLPACGAKFVGKGKAHPEPICCDYVGCYKAGGRGLFFDAKSIEYKVGGIRLHDPKILKRHQAEFLDRMARAGAVAGLLVQLRMGMDPRRWDIFWLPAGNLANGKLMRWGSEGLSLAGVGPRIHWGAILARTNREAGEGVGTTAAAMAGRA